MPRLFLPPGPFLWRIVGRSVVIWLGVRGTLAMLGVGVTMEPSLDLAIPATAVLLAVVAFLGMLDLVRRHERLLHANLGVRDHTMVAATVVLPAALELLLQARW